MSDEIKQPDVTQLRYRGHLLRARHRQALPYLVLALAALVLFGLIRLHSTLRRDAVEGWTLYRPLPDQPQPIDHQTRLAFLNRAASDAARCDRLVSYFFHGFVIDAGSDFARIHYPGLPSASGYSMSGLEGFARTAPLFAAWLYSGRPQEIIDQLTGKSYDTVTVLQQGLLAGTDPSSPNYWGDIHDDDQRIGLTKPKNRVLPLGCCKPKRLEFLSVPTGSYSRLLSKHS
jgi:hypothetical protein